MASGSGTKATIRIRRRTCTAVLLGVALLAISATANASATAVRRVMHQAATSSSLTVSTQSGPVSGFTVQNMEAWEGIPFAAPPTGSLRWEPPQAPAKWTTTLQATQFSSDCPQLASFFGVASTSEDCLHLNVFAPAGTTAKSHLPVMVWIYGGAFIEGGADLYDPDRLVAQGVEVVTINYRLGPLGFLATPQLDAEPHKHINYGIMDQQAALGWVQNNIANFGGNPSNTTIFGESAGGLSVISNILSPGASGLFQHAIIESGAYDLEFPTQSAAETTGSAFATATGCGTSTSCLRSLSVSAILAQEPAGFTAATALTTPAVDGVVIPQAPETALIEGEYNHVPMIQGSNHDEFRLFTALAFDLSGAPLTAAEYPTATSEILEEAGLSSDAQEVLNEYPLKNFSSPDLAFSAWTTDSIFAAGAFISDEVFSLATPLFGYELNDPNAPQNLLPAVSFPYASCHASEIQFLFDTFNEPSIHNPTFVPLSSSEQQLAATMVKYWTNFAKSGSPNGAGTPAWAAFSAVTGNMQRFTPPSASAYLGFSADHKTVFWEGLAVDAVLQGGLTSASAVRGQVRSLIKPATALQLRRPTFKGVDKASRMLRPRLRAHESLMLRLLGE